ncbi:SAM-dependent methyltransferase [Roseimaritima ulvae]|uniref:Cyclopropane-fatty-acyl-phospholipid synthase n=1 Tax=Roseimaritima ulvae TaxID=980254 RepID=A0A5B9R3P9_9BACT|nr:cyclopropane-fatty-acyl-phospholipid synthase family protein [Roseimaritima ulvae]QEG40963.1 Cyclopropane-fatty-acyl-phospholipid synthase [Roseimaritima ulvae]
MPLLYASEITTGQQPAACFADVPSVATEATLPTAASRWQRSLDASCWFRRAVLKRLSRLETGQLNVVDRSGTYSFGTSAAAGLQGTIRVHNRSFYRDLALGGALGAAESYIRGHYDSQDLTAVMRVLAANRSALTGLDNGPARLLRPVRAVANAMRRNTRAGSKRNISAHYDLSNDFFALMLDPSMTYSAGVFLSPQASMEAASIEKYDRICRKLKLRPGDHVLEIGTGWGGFAEHAARQYGCRITTTTISDQQYAYAQHRFAQQGLTDRITLLKQDYRDLRGCYDKLVSIEMIEAVGEKFLPGYFAKCSQLLKAEGIMCLQAITIPDQRYQRYRKSVDFIQRYIFPGGFLPSMGAMAECVGRRTDLRFLHVEDFASHYADTLLHWRNNFWQAIDAVRSLGFDERFIRTWHYYLCYCEAGFRERQIGVSQILLAKPGCRHA